MTRTPSIKTGQEVEWKWGKGTGHGKVAKVVEKDVTEKIKGATVTRKASPAKPAVEIKTDKGAKVLKSVTEVKKKPAKTS